MKIRLTTIAGTPLFNEGKLALRDGQWRDFDTKDLTPEQLDLIEAYTGSIVQFAPEEGMLDRFASAQGLEVENGSLRYPGTAEENKGKPALGSRHQAEASTKTAPGKVKTSKTDKGATDDAEKSAGAAVTGTMGSGPVATDGEKPTNPQPVTPVPTNAVDAASSPRSGRR